VLNDDTSHTLYEKEQVQKEKQQKEESQMREAKYVETSYLIYCKLKDSFDFFFVKFCLQEALPALCYAWFRGRVQRQVQIIMVANVHSFWYIFAL